MAGRSSNKRARRHARRQARRRDTEETAKQDEADHLMESNIEPSRQDSAEAPRQNEENPVNQDNASPLLEFIRPDNAESPSQKDEEDGASTLIQGNAKAQRKNSKAPVNQEGPSPLAGGAESARRVGTEDPKQNNKYLVNKEHLTQDSAKDPKKNDEPPVDQEDASYLIASVESPSTSGIKNPKQTDQDGAGHLIQGSSESPERGCAEDPKQKNEDPVYQDDTRRDDTEASKTDEPSVNPENPSPLIVEGDAKTQGDVEALQEVATSAKHIVTAADRIMAEKIARRQARNQRRRYVGEASTAGSRTGAAGSPNQEHIGLLKKLQAGGGAKSGPSKKDHLSQAEADSLRLGDANPQRQSASPISRRGGAIPQRQSGLLKFRALGAGYFAKTSGEAVAGPSSGGAPRARHTKQSKDEAALLNMYYSLMRRSIFSKEEAITIISGLFFMSVNYVRELIEKNSK